MATFGPQIIMPKRREPACKFIETQARILSVQGNTQCWKPTYSEALKKRNIIMIVFCSILWQVRRYRWLQFPIDRVRFRHFFSVFLVKLTWLYFHWSNSMNKLKVCEIYAVLIQNLHIWSAQNRPETITSTM